MKSRVILHCVSMDILGEVMKIMALCTVAFILRNLSVGRRVFLKYMENNVLRKIFFLLYPSKRDNGASLLVKTISALSYLLTKTILHLACYFILAAILVCSQITIYKSFANQFIDYLFLKALRLY